MKLYLHLSISLFTVFGFSQTWQETHKIVASDRADDDYFGFSGVINDNQIISGAYRNRPTGAVYVFDQIGGTWMESYKLQRNETEPFDEFGRRIIIDNNTLVISDYSTNNSSLFDIGSVYIYKKNVNGIWTEQAELFANAPRQNGNFGLETGLDNNVLVVGSDLGNVNIIEYNTNTNTWDFLQEITTTDGLTSDAAVDINNNRIVVGTFDFDENGINNSGAAYIFEKAPNSGQWVQIQKILSPDLSASQRFGKKVFFFNDFLFIASVESQKVYVYTYNTTTFQYDYSQTISGPSGFGQSMDAENNRLIIGAYRHSYSDTDGSTIPQAGSVRTYVLNSSTSLWELEQSITNSDPDNYYWFGNSVSISNEVIFAGSPYNDTDENNMNDEEKAGAAYIFELDTNLETNDYAVEGFSIYPNPTSGRIHFSNHQTIAKVDVIHSTGQLVKTFSSNFEALSINDLADGIYILKISTLRSTFSFKKIIKKSQH
ncbi:T9SS type A sorting domain-containing protein [Winogradskyella flava]|uniref:T9SS type A sorting domain-containing protein n=1 Tax=Winogradskyella flava TaxID=1884876 RepID=A0A842ISU9_9FLAO|nr:T9SS type A sorting domain-containing protein [Winogradskyella flava]MBC2844876.1 T9SS type A sorting domain-containing protein [Winogradskyella flava]